MRWVPVAVMLEAVGGGGGGVAVAPEGAAHSTAYVTVWTRAVPWPAAACDARLTLNSNGPLWLPGPIPAATASGSPRGTKPALFAFTSVAAAGNTVTPSSSCQGVAARSTRATGAVPELKSACEADAEIPPARATPMSKSAAPRLTEHVYTAGCPAVPNRVRWYVWTTLSIPESIWQSPVPPSCACTAVVLSEWHAALIGTIVSSALCM